MAHDELDRILSKEQVISPSTGFSEAVMREVRREAAAPPDIRFPWGTVMVGLTIPLLALVIGAAWDTRWDPASDVLEGWMLHLLAAGSSPAAAWLGLAAIVMLVPMAAYEWLCARNDVPISTSPTSKI